MTTTDSMSKKDKLMKANKALIAFFTVVLMIGLFPIGMAAFGGSDGAENADAPTEATEATAPVEPDPEEVLGTPSGGSSAEELEAPTETKAKTDAADELATAEDSAAPVEEEAEESDEVDEPIDIDTSKETIVIQAADPDAMPAAGMMRAAISDTTQTINVKPGDTVAVPDGLLTFNDGRVHTLTIGEGITLNADILLKRVAAGRTTLKIYGAGAIKGTGNGSVINSMGCNLELYDTVRIYNGTGSVVEKYKDFGKSGGGILFQRDPAYDSSNATTAWFTMAGGIVGSDQAGQQGNTAQTGGGIFIDYKCKFVMSGGVIGYNESTVHEGGGLYIIGPASGAPCQIDAGTIVGNRYTGTSDWGGGGIFVQAYQTLIFGGAATVTNNTALGLGGGIAGCPHAEMGIGKVANGFALYGNHASKESKPSGSNLWLNDNGMGDIWAYEKDKSFRAEDAQDFYCVYGSFVYGQQFSADDTGEAYRGRYIEHDGTSITKAEDVTVMKRDWLEKEKATVGLTAVGVPASMASRPILIADNYSATHGGGIGCNGTIVMGGIPDEEKWNASWSISFNKELLDGIGKSIRPEADAFEFGLYADEACNELIATAKNDAEGIVSFVLNDKDRFGGTEAGTTYELYVKEIPGTDPKIEYDDTVHTVHATVTKTKKVIENDTFKSTYYESEADVTFDAGDSKLTITNRYIIEPATWAPVADKAYYGNAADPSFGFTLQAIADPTANDNRGKSLAELIRTGDEEGESVAALIKDAAEMAANDEPASEGIFDDGKSALAVRGTASGFADYKAQIAFDKITYKGTGAYWYVLTEDAIEGSYTDASAYVLRVEVSLTSSSDEKVIDALKAEQVSLYYAESIDDKTAGLMPLTGDYATIEFVNFDETGEFGLYSFAVNAVTDQPVGSDQRCLVDPKIYKVLEGRQLKDGQFKFSLIQVGSTPAGGDDAAFADWDKVTTGQVISTASNDQYGMVDFDAANNQAGEGEDPCCLVFTAPGTYHYRVVEVAGMGTDPSIDYSKEVITFTAVITGGNDTPLVCEDMYYGHLVDGKNVRFDESSDPTWHPTMTNKVRPMELKVRKTSATDRNEGLEGATYGLYLVSDNQNDVFLGEATSDVDGWMTFTGEGDEGLDLKTGNLYYFKEIAAPSLHTVSQFRSAYFSIVPDAASEIGYALKYADSRVVSPQAVSLADAGIATLADETTPGVLSDDKMLFTYDLDGGVYDEVTAVEFNKLDGRTHAWVPGAKLAVIDKATGAELESWTTGEAAHRMSKKLDVDTEYILRELEAPDDYHKAQDIVFKLDQYGNLEIISGTENNNAGQNENTLTMFDFMVDAELTLYEYNEREEVKYVDPEPADKTGGDLVQTGDKPFPIELAIAVVAALGIAGFALIRWRRATSKE